MDVNNEQISSKPTALFIITLKCIKQRVLTKFVRVIVNDEAAGVDVSRVVEDGGWRGVRNRVGRGGGYHGRYEFLIT